jgi:D-glycero-D-manno-heptose 1,7-bisphosphate phosphatase
MKAAFLDRDGVVNSLVYHREVGIIDSPFTMKQFHVLPRVPQAVRRLNDLGLAVVIISNQPGIAKRHFDAGLLKQFDQKLQLALERVGAHIDATYYCLHHPQAIVKRLRKRCQCRKPGIGLFKQAASDLGLSLEESYMVGDGITDMEAGARAGCRTVFVGTWKCELCQFIHPRGLRPSFVARDLWDASHVIQSDLSSSGGTQLSSAVYPPLAARSSPTRCLQGI